MEDAALPTKITCLVLFFVISLSCGLLPLVLSRLARCWRRRHSEEKTSARLSLRVDLLLSCVLCLGGGVLIGTVFTHMLPEIREVFDQIVLPGMDTAPAGEIFVCVGFFLVYLVEELVHVFAARGSHKRRADHVLATMPPPPPGSIVVHGDREATAWNDRLYRVSTFATTTTSSSNAITNSTPDVAQERETSEHQSDGHDHGAAIATMHAFRAYVVMMALSVHAVFEGFAVAFESAPRDVWILFAAIATHKAIVSFCLGEQLLATRRSVCFIVSNMLLLALASPLGVTLGIFVEQLDQDERSRLLTTGILQALAAGTILYVVFFEILAPERQKHNAGLLKFLAVVAGFALIVLVHSTGGHSHGASEKSAGANFLHHGHGEHNDHGHGHDDHGHGVHKLPELPVSTDYLARVPNESGHVYDTVKYIKSFNMQEYADVDRAAIVNGMRGVVQKMGSVTGSTSGQHVHHHDDHGTHEVASGRKHNHADHGPVYEHDEHHEEGGKKAERDHDVHSDGSELDELGSGDGHDSVHHDHHADEVVGSNHQERSIGEEEHHHSHEAFMRTVQDLAGGLDGMDEQAVHKTVRLIDQLDLITSRNTGGRHDGIHDDHRHETKNPDHGGNSSSKDLSDDNHGDESAQSDRGSHGADLHSDHAHHEVHDVHFVLQDVAGQRLSPRDQATSSDQLEMSDDAMRELHQMEEVKFHEPSRPTPSV